MACTLVDDTPQSNDEIDSLKGHGKLDDVAAQSDSEDEAIRQGDFKVGDRVLFKGEQKLERGTVRFRGATDFAVGEWFGVELDDQAGKNDGTVKGVKYFDCPPSHGVFCRKARLQSVRRKMTTGEKSMMKRENSYDEDINVQGSEDDEDEDEDEEDEYFTGGGVAISGVRMELLERLWDRADQNDDGILSADEFRRVIHALDAEASEDSIKATYLNITGGFGGAVEDGSAEGGNVEERGFDFAVFVELCGPEGLDTDDDSLEAAFKILAGLGAGVNENPQEQLRREMQEENEKLKGLLNDAGGAAAPSGGAGVLGKDTAEEEEAAARIQAIHRGSAARKAKSQDS